MMVSNLNDDMMELRTFDLKTEAARELFKTLQRMRRYQGRRLTISDITIVSGLSNRELGKAITELERAGLIAVDVDAQELQLIR